MQDKGQMRIEKAKSARKSTVKKKSKLSRIEAQLAQKMGNHFAKLRTAFRTIDEDKSGCISKHEFARVFKIFNIHCHPSEIEKLWNSYDTDGSGEIDYQEFIDQFGSIFQMSITVPKDSRRNCILGAGIED